VNNTRKKYFHLTEIRTNILMNINSILFARFVVVVVPDLSIGLRVRGSH